MQSELNQISSNTRQFLRPRLRKYPKLHNFTISLHRFYCNLTGFLHVLPDFYIIGGQKCGTSSLYDYLTKHPSVYSAISKEPSFFDKYYERGNNWYRVCFPLKTQKHFGNSFVRKTFQTGEASVRYLDHPYTPKRLKQLTPNAKLIVLLRNPIDRAFSQYTRVHGTGRDPLSFEDAIKKEKSRTLDDYEKMLYDENYFGDSYFRYSYLERGIYVDKLKRWMEVFPKEQFLILQSEKFFEDPSKVYNQVLKFLNLPKWELDEYKVVNSSKQQKFHLEPNLRTELIEYFRPHNQRLYEFLGIKFDWDE